MKKGISTMKSIKCKQRLFGKKKDHVMKKKILSTMKHRHGKAENVQRHSLVADSLANSGNALNPISCNLCLSGHVRIAEVFKAFFR